MEERESAADLPLLGQEHKRYADESTKDLQMQLASFSRDKRVISFLLCSFFDRGLDLRMPQASTTNQGTKHIAEEQFKQDRVACLLSANRSIRERCLHRCLLAQSVSARHFRERAR